MDLKQLKLFLEQQQYDNAVTQLINLLNAFELGADNFGQYLVNRIPPEISTIYNEFAQLLTQLFASDQLKLKTPQFFVLALHKHKLAAIFEISEYHNTDHLLQDLLAIPQEKLSEQQLMVIYLLYQFNTNLELPIWDYLDKNPNLAIEAVLGLLTERRIFTEREQHNYDAFMKQFERCNKWLIHDHSAPVLAKAWYQAAYDNGDQKFNVLKTLNHLMTSWLNKHKLQGKAKSKPATDKRKLLVVLEHFHSSHAMYRCFANCIKALKQGFELIAVAEPQELDEPAKQLFDRIIPVPVKTPLDIKKLIKQLNKEQFDAVYFTSVGMKYWCIALANLRLAPIQFVTAGHPISTCTDTIDFMLLEDHKYDQRIHFSETVLGLPSGNFGFVLPEHVKPTPPKEKDALYIGLTATAYKLNAKFLDTIRKICDKVQQKVIVCSFSFTHGLTYYQVSKKLRQGFKELYAFPKLNYNDYLDFLAQCDLYCAPFPFGGTNSTVDCLLLGVVPISLDVPDLACADPFILRKAGLDECVVNSEEDYINTAASLLEDENKRNAIREKMLALGDNLAGVIGDEHSGEAYYEVINKAYTHYDSIKQAQQPFFDYAAITKL